VPGNATTETYTCRFGLTRGCDIVSRFFQFAPTSGLQWPDRPIFIGGQMHHPIATRQKFYANVSRFTRVSVVRRYIPDRRAAKLPGRLQEGKNMRNAMPMQWIEQAEARQVLATAAFERQAQMPGHNTAGDAARQWLPRLGSWIALACFASAAGLIL
jgi:hypothetical protein